MKPAWLGLAAVLALTACGETSAPVGGNPGSVSPAASPSPTCQNGDLSQILNMHSPPPTVIDAQKTYTAVLHTSSGDVTVRLDPKAAPVTVNNFVYLAQHDFYKCLTFHRVEPGFVVQGGDPGNGPGGQLGTGGPTYNLPNETNPAPWNRGSLGMASQSGSTTPNGSQFFILTGDAPSLSQSGVYNHFGVVTAGMDVVDRIQIGDLIGKIDVSAS